MNSMLYRNRKGVEYGCLQGGRTEPFSLPVGFAREITDF